jgi:hypothetical protein
MFTNPQSELSGQTKNKQLLQWKQVNSRIMFLLLFNILNHFSKFNINSTYMRGRFFKNKNKQNKIEQINFNKQQQNKLENICRCRNMGRNWLSLILSNNAFSVHVNVFIKEGDDFCKYSQTCSCGHLF